MKKSIEEKRARLRAKADKVIDEYLAWEASHPQPDLKEIEDIALKLRKELGQELAQVAVEEQSERTPAPGRSRAFWAQAVGRSQTAALACGG